MLASQRLKEKALKEVTNRLEARPIKLKPDWAGPKGNGVGIREVGPVMGWTKQGAAAKPSGVGPRAHLDVNLSKGAVPSWPPDPIQINHQKEALEAPDPNSLTQNGSSYI